MRSEFPRNHLSTTSWLTFGSIDLRGLVLGAAGTLLVMSLRSRAVSVVSRNLGIPQQYCRRVGHRLSGRKMPSMSGRGDFCIRAWALWITSCL